MSHRTLVQPYIIKYIPNPPLLLIDPPHFYGFDLDHTLVKPRTPNATFPRTADDWEYLQFTKGKLAIETLFSIIDSDPQAILVIFTNQGGVITVPSNSKSYHKFNARIQLILDDIKKHKGSSKLLSRLWIYSSTKKPASSRKSIPTGVKNGKVTKLTDFKGFNKTSDGSNKNKSQPVLLHPEDKFSQMRKPEIGLYTEFMQDFKQKTNVKVDKLCWQWYCGDAAGRKSDFSDSDKVFASKIGIPFRIPEEVFLK